MKTLNNMYDSKYEKGIFCQSCIMDLKHKHCAALLLFKTIKLNSSTSNERTTVLVKKNEKKQIGRRN